MEIRPCKFRPSSLDAATQVGSESCAGSHGSHWTKIQTQMVIYNIEGHLMPRSCECVEVRLVTQNIAQTVRSTPTNALRSDIGSGLLLPSGSGATASTSRRPANSHPSLLFVDRRTSRCERNWVISFSNYRASWPQQ